MLIRTAIKNYAAVHKMENCSPSTIIVIERLLGTFAGWLEENFQVVDTSGLVIDHLRGFIVYLQETPFTKGKKVRKRADSTIQNYSINLKAFCHWLEAEEIIEKPISHRFKVPHVEEKFIPTFTPDEVERLLEACEDNGKRWRNDPQVHKALTMRNRAIINVLVDTGIRRSELAGLRLGDIDKDMRVLLVRRKGNKWQQVPISWEGFKSLHEYLTKYRPYLAKLSGTPMLRKDDPVFLNDRGERLTANGVGAFFDRLKGRTGISDKRVSAHNCRRYMATTQLASGRSPLDVQRQMGHTTLMMTNRYASLSVEHLRNSHDQHSPLRRKKSDDRGIHGTGYWTE